MPVAQIKDNGYNLDLKNPNAAVGFEHLPPEQLVDDIVAKEQRILALMQEIKQVLQTDRYAQGVQG